MHSIYFAQSLFLLHVTNNWRVCLQKYLFSFQCNQKWKFYANRKTLNFAGSSTLIQFMCPHQDQFHLNGGKPSCMLMTLIKSMAQLMPQNEFWARTQVLVKTPLFRCTNWQMVSQLLCLWRWCGRGGFPFKMVQKLLQCYPSFIQGFFDYNKGIWARGLSEGVQSNHV